MPNGLSLGTCAEQRKEDEEEERRCFCPWARLEGSEPKRERARCSACHECHVSGSSRANTEKSSEAEALDFAVNAHRLYFAALLDTLGVGFV